MSKPIIYQGYILESLKNGKHDSYMEHLFPKPLKRFLYVSSIQKKVGYSKRWRVADVILNDKEVGDE